MIEAHNSYSIYYKRVHTVLDIGYRISLWLLRYNLTQIIQHEAGSHTYHVVITRRQRHLSRQGLDLIDLADQVLPTTTIEAGT